MKGSPVILALLGLVLLAMGANAQLLGGVTSAPDDTYTHKAADIAVMRLNSQSQKHGSLGAVNGSVSLEAIKSARQQVVAGMKYFLVLSLKDSHGQKFDVEVEVWGRPWLEHTNSDDAWQLTKVQRLDS